MWMNVFFPDHSPFVQKKIISASYSQVRRLNTYATELKTSIIQLNTSDFELNISAINSHIFN